MPDDDELERLAHSPRFQKILDRSRKQIEAGQGIPHDEFWREVAGAPERKKRRGKGASVNQ